MIRAFYDSASWSLLFTGAGELPADPLGGDTNVFVCAALQEPDRVYEMLGRPVAFAPAVARGYTRRLKTVDGAAMPFMLPDEDPGRILTGTVFLDLSADDVAALEVFELAGDLRRRVTIEILVGERRLPAVTYLEKKKEPQP